MNRFKQYVQKFGIVFRQSILYALITRNWDYRKNPETGKRQLYFVDNQGIFGEDKPHLKLEGFIVEIDEKYPKRKLQRLKGEKTCKLSIHEDMIAPFVDENGCVGPQQKFLNLETNQFWFLIPGKKLTLPLEGGEAT